MTTELNKTLHLIALEADNQKGEGYQVIKKLAADARGLLKSSTCLRLTEPEQKVIENSLIATSMARDELGSGGPTNLVSLDRKLALLENSLKDFLNLLEIEKN